MSLHIGTTHEGEAVELPLDALTTKIGIIGRSGSGKTTTALVLAEEFIGAGLPCVLLDPLGVHWGLRSSAAGDAAGLPVTILGGRRGDIPLEETAGQLIADLVIAQPGAYVLDVSGFESRAAERRFATDFAERLYRAKANESSALGLIIDEADTFAPQMAGPDEKRMLGAFEAIARRGRVRGLGMVLITQRPAVLNKNLLSQVEVLFAHQLTAPQDRDALKAWTQANATPEQSEQFNATLASLQVGEAWLWSPSWLDMFTRIQVRARRTFDSSATPKAGEVKVEPQMLAAVDLDDLRARMAETIERAEADDPKKLRATIADLRRQLADRPVADCGHEEIIRDLQGRLETEAGRIASMRLLVAGALGTFESIKTALEESDGEPEVSGIRGDRGDEGASPEARRARQLGEGSRPTSAAADTAHRVDRPADSNMGQVSAFTRPGRVGQSEGGSGGGGVTGPEQRILDALAWWESIGVNTPENAQVAFVAEYSPTSTSYTNPRGALKSKGLLDYPDRGQVMLTLAGRALANLPARAPSLAELHERIMARLPGPEQRILRPLLSAYPSAMSNEQLATVAGYSANSTSYTNPRGRLSSLGLVHYPARGQVAVSALLFPEGVPA